ncbi:MAG: sodium:solute symporter [Acidobacteriota bacterium]
MQGLDLVLIVLYFVIVLVIGFHFARRQSGTEDYFLAGRRLGWVVIGLSLFASNISSTTLVGLSGAAYSTGISISNYEWMAAVVLVFFAIFVIPYYLSSRVYTIPEFLERRFRPGCRYYFSAITLITNIFVDTAGTLFAGALVVTHFFPALGLLETAVVLALVAGLYTAAGGLAAVVYTDTIQAVMILVGATAVTFLAYERVGSWSAVMARTPPEMMSVIRPLDDATMPWLGLLVGVPLLGFYFWCTNQFIVQRVLGARNIHQARWGVLFAGLLKLPVLFIMVFPGVMARVLYPGLARPDLVFPTLISNLLPVGLKGLMLAGLLAAIMSSIDSTLNSASTLVTMDFVRKWKPRAGDETLARIGRISTVVIMFISAAWTPVVARASTLFEYLQSALAYLVPQVVAIFFLGLFWKRATGTGALVGLLTGHALAVVVLILQRFSWFPQIHFLILAGLFFVVTCVVVAMVSFWSEAPSREQIDDYVYSRKSVAALAGAERFPWYKDYRWQSAALLFLTGCLVWTYW